MAFFNHSTPSTATPASGCTPRRRCTTAAQEEIRAQQAVALDGAYAANPARFGHRRPLPPKLPTVAWINEPPPEALIESA